MTILKDCIFAIISRAVNFLFKIKDTFRTQF
jgi:hypothetical protein